MLPIPETDERSRPFCTVTKCNGQPVYYCFSPVAAVTPTLGTDLHRRARQRRAGNRWRVQPDGTKVLPVVVAIRSVSLRTRSALSQVECY